MLASLQGGIAPEPAPPGLTDAELDALLRDHLEPEPCPPDLTERIMAEVHRRATLHVCPRCERAMHHNGSRQWPRWVCRCGCVEEDR